MQAKSMKRMACWAFAVLLGSGAAALQAQENGLVKGVNDKATLVTFDVLERPLQDLVRHIADKAGVNIIVSKGVEANVTIALKEVKWRQALELVAEKADCVVVKMASNLYKVEKPPRVTINFSDSPVKDVIEAIAKISGANIIVAPEVEGTITLRLTDVPWMDALRHIVRTLGYAVVEEDRGILRVVSPASLTEQLERRTFRLKYVRPQATYVPIIESEYVAGKPKLPTGEVADFTLIAALQRVLSANGSLEYIDRSNIIIAKDTRPVLDEIEQMIDLIDVEPAQVFVDVKFVTTDNRDILNVGVDIGDSGLQAALSGGAIPTRLPFDLGRGGWDDDIIANVPYSGQPAQGPFTDSTLNAGTTVIPNTVFGALDFQQVNMVLRLLKQDRSSEIVQAPKIIALDNQESTIFVGDTVRWAQAKAESSQSGGLQLSVQEADNSPVSTGFQLFLVPHIVPGTNKVMMDIIPRSDALTGTGSTASAPQGFDVFSVGSGSGEGSIALPRVSSSTIATKMLLQSGQTAVIGGLTTDRTVDVTTKIPFLGDIPILGYLFKNEDRSIQRESLIVFVTPRVIRSPEETFKSLQNEIEAVRRRHEKAFQDRFDKNPWDLSTKEEVKKMNE
jgi:type II secretory pathway component GspD/PulD (secretin)